ncbi:CocE/NonD family hydrolase [Conexibacter stalactiti]|uniref:CocE/NonD family hydrolase n=1 Tax=Conexibacter stalactiti TaxID=1940611 RepID=A0ABU4HMF3_9ACTN|nr:CocE/NonD family hydrolase [Conexibacter stalactiti]MDW5593894.1 CocE/NonD family hydrolase [Conexibacter stalactiti]MEC5034536.1 CocE/NonD family hydrolase [Conexibacter stalactiti]
MTDVVVRRGVAVPMRDGAVLRADVWTARDDAPRPALLQRTPYDRTDSGAAVVGAALEPLRAVARGFAVVIQDVRGRFASEGTFTPFAQEGDDGEDTLAWVAAQPWCDGRVCMYGGSYVGATQLLAAVRVPPSLAAVAPQLTAAEYWEGWTHQGGAFQLGFLGFWTLGWLAPDALARLAAAEPDAAERLAGCFDALADDPDAALALGPAELGARLRPLAPYLEEWRAHPARDGFWEATAIRDRYARVTTPALHVAGWHDIFLAGTLANFAGLRAHAATAAARDGQRLIVGPWTHAALGDTLGERRFGRRAARAALDLTRLQLDFFAAVLRGEQPLGAPVRIFTMGADRWRDLDAWPPPGAVVEAWELGEGGGLGPGGAGMAVGASVADEGSARDVAFGMTGFALDDAAAAASPSASAGAAPSVLLHDPADPVPAIAGATFLPGQDVTLRSGPRDRRPVQARADVLVFESAPLTEEAELTGELAAEIWVALDRRGGDVVVALSELLPDGRALHLADGVARLAAGAPGADGGAPVAVRVELGATSVALPAGRRLRAEVCGSCFPRFDVHPAVPARHAIFHDAARPSRLLLPFLRARH